MEFADDISIGRGFKSLPSTPSEFDFINISKMLSIMFSEFGREFGATPRYHSINVAWKQDIGVKLCLEKV
jgi:hypothetical protein